MTLLHVVRYLKARHSFPHKLFERTQDGICIWSDENRKKWYMESECTVPALKYTTIIYITIFLDLQPIL